MAVAYPPCFPIAIVFALLGRHFPSAGGVAHFVDMAFGPRLASVTGWLFLSVIPVGLPAALHIATGFGQALFGWHDAQLLLAELGTRHRLVGRFTWRQLQRQPADAGCRADRGADRRRLVARWHKPGADPSRPGGDRPRPALLRAVGDVLVLCRPEAFAHLASEFKHPERDFPAR